MLQLARIGLIVVKDTWASRVSARVKETVRERITLKLMEIGQGQAQRMRTGDLQSTLVDSVEYPLPGPYASRPTVWRGRRCPTGYWSGEAHG
ncbi:hypothetical protein ACHBTE_00615 [Streptomyces sp. M41]|uniref:hypothetical protein n=1 Tax=Streptomyces sp. M41 TaxID=3059412 RepID=UPI00374DC525